LSPSPSPLSSSPPLTLFERGLKLHHAVVRIVASTKVKGTDKVTSDESTQAAVATSPLSTTAAATNVATNAFSAAFAAATGAALATPATPSTLVSTPTAPVTASVPMAAEKTSNGDDAEDEKVEEETEEAVVNVSTSPPDSSWNLQVVVVIVDVTEWIFR
jgi:hypothetical protein